MLPLAISSGDPSGIGPEIALKAWQLRETLHLPPFFLIADPELIIARAAFLGLNVPVNVTNEDDPAYGFGNALPVLPLEKKQKNTPGIPNSFNAAGTIEAIERAVDYVNRSIASAVVTCPIAKKPLYDAGFHFPGHTEFLAFLAEKQTGIPVKPVMMLAGPRLKTVPVTVHIALHDVASQLTRALIIETAQITINDLKNRFGLDRPRLAIAGLNPHAGEGGTMGHEDEEIVRPAVEELKNAGIHAFGPLPSDTMFHFSARETYDVALCMYHDQALIPVKTIGFDDTVNVTLGLPFIRTSPDHGTAFDIAHKGSASPESLIAAIRMAAELVQNTRA